jgi:hypothetical protein
MSYNLIRNARVFFTTNVGTTTGVVAASGFTATNTREIQVLDGMSFSQNTTTETVTLNEAGAAPVRGQRQFNTALDPVDFSFTTYMRPQDGGANITAEESVLWNAMFAVDPIGGSNPAWTETNTYGQCVATNSEKHQLQKFGLIIVLDTTTFIIDDCVLNTATVDFGLDAIASIQWAGQGRYLRQIATPTFVDADTWSGTLAGDYKVKNTTAPYIANKLSVLELNSGFTSGSAYTIALTGGSLSISNNVTYLVPANLGVVNQPATYFTGTRSITGTLNCYLRTGTLNSAGLIDTLLTGSTTEVNPVFRMNIKVGGTGADRVEFNMPSVVLSIPSVNTEQVVSTAITFTAQGSANNLFDIASANELNVKYYTTNVAGV